MCKVGFVDWWPATLQGYYSWNLRAGMDIRGYMIPRPHVQAGDWYPDTEEGCITKAEAGARPATCQVLEHRSSPYTLVSCLCPGFHDPLWKLAFLILYCLRFLWIVISANSDLLEGIWQKFFPLKAMVLNSGSDPPMASVLFRSQRHLSYSFIGYRWCELVRKGKTFFLSLLHLPFNRPSDLCPLSGTPVAEFQGQMVFGRGVWDPFWRKRVLLYKYYFLRGIPSNESHFFSWF